MILVIDVPELTDAQLADIKAASNKTITWMGGLRIEPLLGGDRYRPIAMTPSPSAKIDGVDRVELPLWSIPWSFRTLRRTQGR